MKTTKMNSELKKNKTEISKNNNSQTHKNNIEWIVVENNSEKDYIACAVYECGKFDYRINVTKNERNKNLLSGQILKSCNLEFNYLSPDGFTISIENFLSKKEADDFLERWVKGFQKQGYYSSVKYGRVPLNLLKSFCEFKKEVIEE